MASTKLAYQTATSLTVTGLSTLSNGSTATSDAVDNSTNLYLDHLVEINVTVGTVSGNKRVLIYAISSLDGTNYSDASDLSNTKFLGALSTPTNATAYRSPAYSVAAAFGGVCPQKFKIVVKNDSGTALTAGTAQTQGVYSTVA